MWPFKKCEHVWGYRKIYGDEIHMYGGERDLWTCSVCRKRTTRKPENLNHPEPYEGEDE